MVKGERGKRMCVCVCFSVYSKRKCVASRTLKAEIENETELESNAVPLVLLVG